MMHRYNTRSNDVRTSPRKEKLSYDLTIVEEKEEEAGYTDRDYAELIVDEVLDQYSSKYGVDLDSDKIFKIVQKTLQKSKGLSEKRELELEEEEEEETVSESEEEVLSSDETAVDESVTDYQSEEVESEQEEYYEELQDAISHVRKLAKSASKRLFRRVMDEYRLETGEYPSLSELETSVEFVKETLLSDEYADEEENVNEVRDIVGVLEFADELELALDVASKMGEIDQEYLVNQICDQFTDINDEEPDVDDLYDIFDRVKEALQDEAMEELADDISVDSIRYVEEFEYIDEEEESDDDEDYCITVKDIVQSIKDDMDLKAIESAAEDEYSEDDEIVEFESEEESEDDESEDSEDDSDYDPDYDEQDYTGDYQLYR